MSEHGWWTQWVWQEHILPADFITIGEGKTAYRVPVAEKRQGSMYFYINDPLWQYTEKLYVYEDIERLLDVLQYGDWLSMLKAMMAMEELNASHPRFLRLLESISDGSYQYASIDTFTDTTKAVLVNYANAVLWRNDPAYTPEERAFQYARVMGTSYTEKPVFAPFSPDPDSTDEFDVWMRMPDVKSKRPAVKKKAAAVQVPTPVPTPTPVPVPVPMPPIPVKRPPVPKPVPTPIPPGPVQRVLPASMPAPGSRPPLPLPKRS